MKRFIILIASLILISCNRDFVLIQTKDYEIYHAYGVILPIDNPKGYVEAEEAIFYADHTSLINFVFRSKEMTVKGKHAIIDDEGIKYDGTTIIEQ